MTILLHDFMTCSIEYEIQQHPAWLGYISGLKAEKLLRGLKRPYLYVIRSGEDSIATEQNYYVSFIEPDCSIKHQPFIIFKTPEGWWYENGGGGGPYIDKSIEDVLHLIMHCAKEECVPLSLYKMNELT